MGSVEAWNDSGAARKGPGGRLRMALVYPNTWRVGMANLGVHAVYRIANEEEDVLCERAFLPDAPGAPVRSVETGTALSDFDVVAFSLSFEEDYLHVLEILHRGGFPLRAAERGGRFPLVVAGGIAMQINPEPVAPFFDAILVGEAEVLLPPFFEALRELRGPGGAERGAVLRRLAAVPGGYVPELHEVEHADTRAPGGAWVIRREARHGAPVKVARRFVPDLRQVATSRVVGTPDALFGDLHLTEVARGCLWGCRFCAAGFVQRPYREVDLEVLRAEAARGIARGQRIGLVGPDTSDYTGLEPLTCHIAAAGGTFSPSSLRVDAITPELSRRMAEGGERSVTLAPEAGTDRLRKVVNKDFPDDRVVEAAEHAISQGMRNVKMYFMYGLPTETDDDVRGMARLALRIRDEVMAPRARTTRRMGRITLSVNPFVPKPWTPFQWAPVHDEKCLAARRRILERELRPRGVELDFFSPREAAMQTLLSRGDRRAADLLEIAWRETGGNLHRALARWPHDPDFYLGREVGLEEALPWDFIDHGLTKSFLAREYRRGVAGRVTPRCDLARCRACGLDCADHPELALPPRPGEPGPA